MKLTLSQMSVIRRTVEAMSCPSCLVYDDLIDLCIDPCKELGADSHPCQEFGCPIDESSTVQTSTVGQSPVPSHLPAISDDVATNLTVTFTAVVVAIVSLTVMMLGIVLLRRRRHRSSINDHTSRTRFCILVGLLLCVFTNCGLYFLIIL